MSNRALFTSNRKSRPLLTQGLMGRRKKEKEKKNPRTSLADIGHMTLALVFGTETNHHFEYSITWQNQEVNSWSKFQKLNGPFI